MEGPVAAVLTLLSFAFIVAVAAWLTILPTIGLLYITGYLH